MEMTQKAVKEIDKLESEIRTLKVEAERYREKAHSTRDWEITKMWHNKMSGVFRKIDKKKETIQGIKTEGISTSERRALEKEAWDWKVTEYRRDLGCRSSVREGISKILNGKKVRAHMTSWTGFMANVKGCASLAGKRYMDRFEILEG